jgi:glycerophosphoryl diester phosphodiesterase
MAHRGASKVEVENTVAAFRRAAEMGAQAVELDVRRTSDGVLVVHHNPNLDDRRLIAGTAHADLPVSLPTLSEALDACAGMWVNVEIKNDPEEPDFDPADTIADETVAHLLARHEDERWLISCFRIETIDRCHALAPHLRTAWLSTMPPHEVADDLASRGHSAVHPWFGAVTPELIQSCHARGLQVNVWTCDDPVRMAELISWGVDGICTNVPDVALRVIAAAAGAGEPA